VWIFANRDDTHLWGATIGTYTLAAYCGIAQTMREFVFDLVYETAPGPLERLLTDATAVSSTGFGGSIDNTEFWRFERFDGPSDAIDELRNADESDLLGVEQITETACNGSVHREVLTQSDGECELYYHLRDLNSCESIGTLAVEYIGSDVLFEVKRERGQETWTVMMETEDGVGLFYDAIQVSLRPGVRFEFGHIGQASERRTALFASKNLPPEQREALVEAVRQGYYEKPRQVTLDELSEELGCPRSTLSYRLRSAESKLAKAFATSEQPAELESFPQTPDQRGES
jgi:hypothetical protein